MDITINLNFLSNTDTPDNLRKDYTQMQKSPQHDLF